MGENVITSKEYLYRWFCSHNVDEDVTWYFSMILELNEKELLDTILCLYISCIENDTIDIEEDHVFNIIYNRSHIKLLADLILNWANYVDQTIHYYGELYDEMMDSFIKYLQRYPVTKYPNLAYRRFIDELLWIYQKSQGGPNLKSIGRYLRRFRKEK